MRGIYIIFGLMLIAIPTFACGWAIDTINDQHTRWLPSEKIGIIFKDGFKASSPISIPLAIFGIMLVARGVTGRCTRRKRASDIFVN